MCTINARPKIHCMYNSHKLHAGMLRTFQHPSSISCLSFSRRHCSFSFLDHLEGLHNLSEHSVRSLEPSLVSSLRLEDEQSSVRNCGCNQLVATSLVTVGGSGQDFIVVVLLAALGFFSEVQKVDDGNLVLCKASLGFGLSGEGLRIRGRLANKAGGWRECVYRRPAGRPVSQPASQTYITSPLHTRFRTRAWQPPLSLSLSSRMLQYLFSEEE